jgi:drug/metabolite transporter (DMT)-like permease
MSASTVKSENTKTSPLKSQISMLLSGICMGIVGLFVSFLGHYHLSTVVLLRGIFGVAFLTLFMIKTHSFSREFFNESFKFHWKALIISGLIYPFVIYLYFLSITIYGYAIAAFLLYTSGIFVLLLIILTRMEKVSKINIVSFVLAILGVGIIMEFWNSPPLSLSLMIGISSGIALSFFIFYKKIIYNKRKTLEQELKAKGDFDIFLAWWHALFLIFIFLPFGASELPKLTYIEWMFAVLLGLIPTALAFTLYNIGVKNDKGGNIIILSYVETVVATINTIIFLNTFSIYTIIGGVLIILANIIVLKYSGRKEN